MSGAIDEIARCDRSDDRIARRLTNGAIDEWCASDKHAHRSTIGAIDERCASNKHARRSTIALLVTRRTTIAPLVAQCDRPDDLIARRSTSGAIDERCASDKRARRSTIAPLVTRRSSHRSSHRDRTARCSSLIHFLLLGFGFFCLI